MVTPSVCPRHSKLALTVSTLSEAHLSGSHALRKRSGQCGVVMFDDRRRRQRCGVHAGMAIFWQDHREPQFCGYAASGIDTELGFHPNNHQFIDLCCAQSLRQIGAEETTGTGFIEEPVTSLIDIDRKSVV